MIADDFWAVGRYVQRAIMAIPGGKEGLPWPLYGSAGCLNHQNSRRKNLRSSNPTYPTRPRQKDWCELVAGRKEWCCWLLCEIWHGCPDPVVVTVRGRDTLVRVGHSHAKRCHHHHLPWVLRGDPVAPFNLPLLCLVKIRRSKHNQIPTGSKRQRILSRMLTRVSQKNTFFEFCFVGWTTGAD